MAQAKNTKTIETGIIERRNKNGTKAYLCEVVLKGHGKQRKRWDTLEQARKWRFDTIQSLKNKSLGIYVAPEGSIGELVKLYIKEFSGLNGGWSRGKQDNLDKLIAERGHIMVRDWTAQTTVDYGYALRKTRGPGGVAQRLNSLSKVFKVAKARWNIDTPRAAFADGMASLRVLNEIGTGAARDRIVEPHEIAKIKPYLSATAQDLLDFLMIVPFRVGETCAIEWKHVDEVNRRVQLFRKNTDQKKKTYARMEWVPLPQIEVVRDGKAIVVDTFDLIAKRDRSQLGPFPISQSTMTHAFSKAHVLAGIEDIHLHDCRGTALGALFDQGFGVETACVLSGHKDWKVVQEHYNRRKPRSVHELFKRQIRINQQARAAA